MSEGTKRGLQRKESLSRKREVKEKLMSGEYRTTQPETNIKSTIWTVFKPIVDGEGKYVNFVSCSFCSEVYAYVKGSSGTSHISRHPCVSNKQASCVEEKRLPKPAQDIIVEKCVAMCARDLRSYGTIGGKGFIDLAQTLIDTGATYGKVSAKAVIPHPSTVSRHIAETAKSLREKIMPEVIARITEGDCAATTDMWTCNGRRNHYLTCTVSYFVDWTLRSRVLFTTQFPDEPKTGDNIRRELLRRFMSLGINEICLKEMPFTTDQGTNIVAALRDYSRLNCSCHMLNTVLRNAFNEEYMCVNCPQVQALLTAAKELVTYAKKSGLLNDLDRTLEQANDTRWNTRLTMLESIESQYSALCEKLTEKGETARIEGIDITLMNELISLLKPFKEASKELELEASPTLHLLLPWKMTLLQHLSQAPHDRESSEITLLCKRLKLYLEEKLIVQRSHEVATFLWPPFRHLKMISEDKRREVMAEVRKIMMKESSANLEEAVHQLKSTESLPPKVKKFAMWADVVYSPTLNDELDRYLNQDCEMEENVASYWKANGQKFPTLQKIARKILSIQASSSASERNFSSAGFVLSARRSLLHPDNVDAILFIHSNSVRENSEEEC